jgi:hypothetical protein
MYRPNGSNTNVDIKCVLFTRGTYKINKACITFVLFPLGSVNIKLKVIPETRRAHTFDIYICITTIGSIHMVMDY